MAQGNLILGTMKGKLGDVVAYNYNGKQAARVRRRQVSNPKTSKQAIQRAIAATVAKFVSTFAPVLNNSLQNEGSKVSTLAKIRSLNMNMLRQQAAQNKGAYVEKGSMYVAPNPYLISRGTLAGLNPVSEQHLGDGCILFDPADADPEGTAGVNASKVFPGIAVGDQITVLAAWMEDAAEGSHFGYCRFAFKDDTTDIFISDEQSGILKLNPAAVDQTKAEGNWQGLRFGLPEYDEKEYGAFYVGALVGEAYNNAVDLAGVIVSREAGKLRSTAHMVSSASSDYTLAQVYPTYMDGGTPVDMPSELYLNNDANAQG